jgi:hypothetical protein
LNISGDADAGATSLKSNTRLSPLPVLMSMKPPLQNN